MSPGDVLLGDESRGANEFKERVGKELVMNKFKLGVGEAHEFEVMARKAGWRPADFTRLTKDLDIHADILAVLRGEADIRRTHVVDCSGKLEERSGYATLVEHERQLSGRVTGQVTLDIERITLYVDPSQTDVEAYLGNSGTVTTASGYDLLERLESKPVLTVHILRYLLAHPKLIPESWRDKQVYFWGTIFSDGRVLYLYWKDGQWRCSGTQLIYAFFSKAPAAILNSQ